MSDILQQLSKLIDQRKQASAEQSYVAQLHAKGLNKILEKVGEEATEAILAAKDCSKLTDQQHSTSAKQALINETADLWFHSLVMLSHLDCSAGDVLKELERREGISGITEKASRDAT